MRVLLVAAVIAVGLPAAAGGAGRIDRVEIRRSEMTWVPGGRFTMGVGEKEGARLLAACRDELGLAAEWCDPTVWANTLYQLLDHKLLQGTLAIGPREIILDPFYIDRREVTAAQFRACVAAGACDVAALVSGDPRYLRDEWPMVNVTWQDAVDYCTWRGKRLPTDAEWERAARGHDGRRWPWGNHERLDGGNFGRVESGGVLRARQGQLPVPLPLTAPDDRDGARYAVAPGAMRWTEGPYGTMDQAGNVAEWVADYYTEDGWAGLPRVNPVRSTPRGTEHRRIFRGGSWFWPRFLGRTYVRSPADAGTRWPFLGFRCARDAR